MGVTTLPNLKDFRPRKLPQANNSGYESNILLSNYHVKLSPVAPDQTTLTRGISLPLNVFTFRSSILTGKVSTVRLSRHIACSRKSRICLWTWHEYVLVKLCAHDCWIGILWIVYLLMRMIMLTFNYARYY